LTRTLTNTFALIFFCVLGIDLNAQDTIFYSTDRPERIQCIDKNGLKTGIWKWYYKNGNLQRSGEYKSGLMNGAWTDYYTDGSLQVHRIYKNDSIIELTEYHSTSTIYQSGKFHGHYLQTGDWKFYTNKHLTEIGFFKDGNKDGEWKYYYENGQLESKGHYKNGIPIGEWRHYHSNGQLARFGIHESTDKKVEWKYYDESGKLINR